MRQLFTNTPLLSAVVLAALLARLSSTGLSWIGVAALLLCVVWFSLDSIRHLLRWRERLAAGRSDEPGKKRRIGNATAGEQALGREGSEGIKVVPGGHMDSPMLSLVYFLSEPRHADEATIQRIVSDALGVTFLAPEIDATHLVMGVEPDDAQHGHLHFFVVLPLGTFAILISPAPYIDDPAAFARDSIRDKRLRTAIIEHRAWISVDYVEETSRSPKEELYSAVGKIMASLAGPDCLAVYSPELQRCNEFDPSLIETLSGGHPLDLFDEPTFEPIIEIADNDPRMAAAVKKARKRWREFEKAFDAREDRDSEAYLVKAEFRESERCEFMWVSVREITEKTIRGVLMNDPHELLELHRGADVSVALERLNDWIYPKPDGSHAGGFTLDVLAEDEDDA